MRYRALLLALGLAWLPASAQTAADNNQSLIKADRTCQRIVLDSAAIGDGAPVEGATWHDDFSPLLAGLELSYGDLDDHALGKGATAWDAALSLSTTWRERLHLHALTGYEHYRWDGDAFRLRGEFVELAALYAVTDTFLVGPFVEAAFVGVETAGASNDDRTVLASGLLAAESWQAGDFAIGLTGTLASMNKRNPGDLFRQEETAIAGLLDVRYALDARTGLTPYVYYYSLLDNPRTTDAHYWLFGLELDRQLSARWLATVGVSTVGANADYEEQRLTASLAYQF
jgi:hypothetical protein